MNEVVNYFQILLNDTTNPCMLVDNETLEAVFLNHSMENLLKESNYLCGLNSRNAKCYELLHNTSKPCKHCNIDSLEKDFFSEFSVYNENLDRNYRVSNTTIQFKGKNYNLNKFFISSSYVNTESNFNEAITKSVKIFAKKDLNEMTNGFLQLIGEFYQSEKSYVYYLNKERSNLINKYKWVFDNSVVVPSDIVSRIKMKPFTSWLNSHDDNGIVEVSNFKKDRANSAIEDEIIQLFNINSITLCVMKNNEDEIIGFVGVSNRSIKKFDYRLLKSVTNFIQEKFNSNDMQDDLKNMGDIDFLTGFYSRNKYIEQLKLLELTRPKSIGVVFANINGLKKVNDYSGPEAGDKLIVRCSKILEIFFDDPIYRISGDEFICFCVGQEEDEFIEKVNSLRDFLKQNDEHPFAVGHSWRNNGFNIQKLVVEADVVMYINKQEYYHSSIKTIDDINDTTLKELLGYLANDEFMVYLQPQVELSSGDVIAAEALVRRYDKTNEQMIFPDQFIPLYEQKSVIRHVDFFVIDKVCQTLSKWLKFGKKISIAVNLSRVTLIEYDIVNSIATICDNYEVPYYYLIIEVTERIGLIENDIATTLIDQFKERGFRVSLDDFGCAYSNIVTLANISVDEVKIDKSLVDNLIGNNKNQIIVDSVISMCNRIGGMHTLAEGIETREQANILQSLHCQFGQGYLYSRPIPLITFEENYVTN